RFSGTGRASDEKNSVRQLNQALECLLIVAKKAELGQTEHQTFLVENTNDNALAVIGRDGRDSKIDRLLFDFDLNASVLRQPFFRDAHRTGHDLEPADDR